MTTVTDFGSMGEWTFYEVTDHGFSGTAGPLYAYGDGTLVAEGRRAGQPVYGELFFSLDQAMVAAVAEKHTGTCGARGTAVGTAADWFMRMIGAGQLVEAGPDGGRALHEVLKDSDLSAHQVERALDDQGYVIARKPL